MQLPDRSARRCRRRASRACGCCAASRGVDPESLDAYSRPAASRRSRARASSGRRGDRARSRRRGLLGRGGAAFPTGAQVGGGRAPARAAALPRLQRRRVGAGDVQGPRADGGGSVRARRGDGDRRASRPAASKGFVYVRAEYPLAHARLRARDRRTRARRELLDGLRDRAPHRRGRVRVRRGDRALPVDRGLPRRAAQQAAVPGRGRPVRQADRRQQRRDALQRARGPADGGGVRRDRHEGSTARGSSASPATSRGPGCTSCRSARRCASCSTSPAPSRRRRCCSAARPARSSARTSSTCSSRYEDTRAAGVTLGSGVVIVFDESADLRDARSCGSRSSSATSRAASACRAASAPCARRRRCTGSPRDGRTTDELRHARRGRAGDARRVDLRARPDGGERGRVRDRESESVVA